MANNEELISLTFVKELMNVQKDTIISFFKETIANFNDRLDKVLVDVQELKSSQTFLGDVCKEKNDSILSQVKGLKDDLMNIKQLQAKTCNDTKILKEKSIELEDRNRRNNIRIDGVVENEKESWSEKAEKVKAVLKNNLHVNDVVQIERAHRVGEKKNGRSRTIVCKLLNYNDKEKIKRNVKMLKGTNIYINDDYSEETTNRRKELFAQRKIHRDNGLYAKVSYNKIIVREFRKNGEALEEEK